MGLWHVLPTLLVENRLLIAQDQEKVQE